MEPPLYSALRIGDLRVDPALDEIYKDGSTIKVEPRTMRLLLCLAEHAGQVVSVDQLLAEVWKDVIVGPDSVYQAVAGLRRMLGDDPKSPVYIANVPRRGYRLVAPVAPWSRSVGQGAGLPPGAAEEAGKALPGNAVPVLEEPLPTAPAQTAATRWPYLVPGITVLTLLALVLGAFLIQRLWRPTHRIVDAGADKSVAVLPFLDLSEKKDEGYFADGMSEELIDLLARVPELRVPARTSSFYFKGKQATLPDIAKELGVNHVIEGSVRKSGEMLRVTANLIRVDTGYQVWSETFDRPMSDVFKIQDEIAAAVVGALKVSLLPGPSPKPALTTNAAAYSLYLKAKSLETGGYALDYETAKQYIQQALALDPGFAAGWAALSGTILDDYNWHEGYNPDRCARARQAADEAIRLDPNLADGHSALAAVHSICDWDWKGAEAELKRALELDPGNATTLHKYASTAYVFMQYDQALELAQRAVQRDPLNAWNYSGLAFALGAKGRTHEAVAAARKAIELNPTAAGLHGLLANALLGDGEPEAALAEDEREPDEGFRTMNYALIDEGLGRKTDADREIAALLKKDPNDGTATVAEIYACRKEIDKVIPMLQRIVASHNTLEDTPNRQGCFKNLEGDPRYQALLRKLGIPARH
jgi:TolB-like protein/DNA-binding winged helix-turn-helix (wHTH) protein